MRIIGDGDGDGDGQDWLINRTTLPSRSMRASTESSSNDAFR